MPPQEKGTLSIDWKKALGASRVIPLNTSKITTPIDLLALREEILSLTCSEAGGSTDQDSIAGHEIPLRDEIWATLEEISHELNRVGTRTVPEQLAALFIEDGILRHKQSSKK